MTIDDNGNEGVIDPIDNSDDLDAFSDEFYGTSKAVEKEEKAEEPAKDDEPSNANTEEKVDPLANDEQEAEENEEEEETPQKPSPKKNNV